MMNAKALWRREAPSESRRHELDAVYAELMETVLAQERSTRREDRIDAIVRYANPEASRMSVTRSGPGGGPRQRP